MSGSGGTITAPLGRYSTVAIAFHWAIALLIIANWPLGLVMEGFPPADRKWMVPLHVSIGMTVLVLSLGRLAWRLMHRPPPMNPTLKPWESWAAHIAHWGLYALMIGMPAIGWGLMSCHPPKPGTGPMIWGLFHLPKLPMFSHMEKLLQDQMHDMLVEWHMIGGWILLAVFAAHVAGALKHQFLDRHPELQRMGVGKLNIDR